MFDYELYNFFYKKKKKKMIQEYFNYVKIYFSFIRKSLLPTKKIKNIWKLSIYDLITFLILIFPTLLTWLYAEYKSSVYDVIQYWDGPNYIYVAKTLYSIPLHNPWSDTLFYPPSYFACHLPGYPLLIRFISFFTLGNYFYASFLSIIFNNFIVSYSFRRLLIVYHCTNDPFFATCVLSIVPFRFFVYRSVLASEPLFLASTCFALIFYKFDMKSFMIISVWICCITRIEGMAVGFVIGLCYLIRLDILNALLMFVTFIPDLFLIYIHYSAFHDPLAYIHFNSDNIHIMTNRLFFDLFIPFQMKYPLMRSNTMLMYYLPLIGIIATFPIASPIAILCLVFYLYVSMLFHLDTARYMIPCTVFSYIIGFNTFFTRFPTKLSCCAIYLIASLFLVYFTVCQLNDNKCTRSFLMDILKYSPSEEL